MTESSLNTIISKCCLIDGHTHSNRYQGNYKQEMLQQIRENKILTLSSATDSSSIRESFILNKECPWILTAAGIHPWNAGDFNINDLEPLEEYYRMAHQISEIGMDGLWAPERATLIKQEELLEAQLQMAWKLNKPVTLHTKDAEDQVYSLLKERQFPSVLIHWFDGNDIQLKKFMDLNCFFTIPPSIITSQRSREILLKLPLNRLIPETDNPPAWPWLFDQPARADQIDSVISATSQILDISGEKLMTSFKNTVKSFFSL